MTTNDAYNEIKKNYVSKLALKRDMYILFSLIDMAAAVVVMIEFSNYYSLFIFGFALMYFIIEFFIYKDVIKNEKYVVAELTCTGAGMSQFGYSLTNSKIYNFIIESLNNNDPKKFNDKWNKKNNITNQDEFSSEIQLQFTYNMRLADIKKSFREKNLKYNKDDKVYMLFMTNKKRPLSFTNATMLMY